MAHGLEIRIQQKRELFRLLKIQAKNKGNYIEALEEEITSVKTEMEIEDISHVEKMINQQYNK